MKYSLQFNTKKQLESLQCFRGFFPLMLNDFPAATFQLSFKCTLLSLSDQVFCVKSGGSSEIQRALGFLSKPDVSKRTLKFVPLPVTGTKPAK